MSPLLELASSGPVRPMAAEEAEAPSSAEVPACPTSSALWRNPSRISLFHLRRSSPPTSGLVPTPRCGTRTRPGFFVSRLPSTSPLQFRTHSVDARQSQGHKGAVELCEPLMKVSLQEKRDLRRTFGGRLPCAARSGPALLARLSQLLTSILSQTPPARSLILSWLLVRS